MDIGTLSVVADTLDVTLDEDVTWLFTSHDVDVVERHLVCVPDDTAQLVAALSHNKQTLRNHWLLYWVIAGEIWALKHTAAAHLVFLPLSGLKVTQKK